MPRGSQQMVCPEPASTCPPRLTALSPHAVGFKWSEEPQTNWRFCCDEEVKNFSLCDIDSETPTHTHTFSKS